MPYPFDPPKSKHDLLCPKLPATNLLDEFGFTSSAALFQALRGADAPAHVSPICAVYSYADAPAQPLSRGLMVLGVAEESLSVVRNLVQDEDNVPTCLHKCTIAVKRADGSYGQQLREKDISNSHALAKFLRRLRKEGLVAILGKDKLGRFGILKPTEDMALDGEFEGQDFAAICFVGNVKEVQNYLTQGVASSNQQQPAAAAPPVEEPSASTDGLWVPPGGSGGDSADQGESSASGLWVPPGGGDSTENGESGFSWNPPTNGGAEASYDFGSQDNGTSSWQVDETNDKKRKAEDDENQEFHADSGAAAADLFYSTMTRSLDTRANSRIFHMRAFNGWVKATQIQELDPITIQSGRKTSRGPMRVLDLACGKGGDLGKWTLHVRGISNYVGIDVARGSLKDAAIRARQMRQKLTKCTFTCADLGADVPGRLKSPHHKHMQKLLTWSLQNEPLSATADPEFRLMRGGGITLQDRFDVVSIQFAIHYMMSTKKRARRFFRTVSELLEVGGNLIATTIDARVVLGHMMNLGLDLHSENPKQEAQIKVGGGACRIVFEPEMVKRIFHLNESNTKEDEHLFGLQYTFILVDGEGVDSSVNLPEWLTPIPVLKSLAEEVGLEMEYAHNFHEYFEKRKDPSAHAGAHSSLYSMKVVNRHGSISDEEWEISRLYAALKFRKVREPPPMTAEDEEAQDNEEPEEEDEIDPAIKAKFLPMAMMKAKKAAGDEAWKSLSSEERMRLTDVELRKLAKK